jgi:hypothetical protein
VNPPDRICYPRPRPAIGIRVLTVPAVPHNAVHDCLSRLPIRQSLDRVGGLLLWLPLPLEGQPSPPQTDPQQPAR